MMTLKAGRPLIELLKLCYVADRPVMVVGRHGVGKSELFKRTADELKIDYLCRDLSLMESVDLTGLPKLDDKVTRFVPPSFLPTSGKGLIVFEELNRCQPSTRTPCLQLLTTRTLNDYALPPGWLPVAATNPPESDYEVDELDAALASRFVQATVEPDRAEWLEWAGLNNVHPGVIRYVEADPTVFDRPESNPRAWVYVSQLIHAHAKFPASGETVHAAVAGLVGVKRATAFLRVLKDKDRPLTAEEILAYPRHRQGVQHWIAGGQLDLVSASLLALRKHLQARPNYEKARKGRTSWKNLGDFIADLPGDLREQAEDFFKEREYDLPGTRRAQRR